MSGSTARPGTDPGVRHGVMQPLSRQLLHAPAPEVAVALLGALIVRREPDSSHTVARIAETEAYRQDDPASHSYARRTPRTEPMFAAPGTGYVYRSYGVHWCCNVSVEGEGTGAAVLLRAAIVLGGEPHVRVRRPRALGPAALRGPGNLCAGLDIDGPRHDASDLCTGDAGLALFADELEVPTDAVASGPRVGVSRAAQWPWRFWLDGRPEVSAYRRSRRAETPRT
ncbi:MAG: DNA-3-methyladenine glycosylase [Nitriliruptoraceae bacterium]|nr:DNA-3-methyladenine glycosylase [Nitriliruptoraceae bacterium]